MRILTIILVLFLSSVVLGSESEKKNVIKTFESYREAILSRNGERAYDLVDSNTKQYYADALEKVLTLPAPKTMELPLSNKMFVLRARQIISPQELKKMDGKGLFMYVVANSWIGEDVVTQRKIRVKYLKEGVAKTHFLKGPNQEIPIGYSFRKEQEAWKIDLTSILPMMDATFKQMITKMGINEEAFLFGFVETLSGKKVDHLIWRPIK